MKNYAKIGNRKGKPAYRTPSHFRTRVHIAHLRSAASASRKLKREHFSNSRE